MAMATLVFGGQLVTLPGCKWIQTPWADGDSFRIKTSDGVEHTIRLYGADCFEWHVSNATDSRRLRAQRRHFGISDWGGSAEASIEAAKNLGKLAAEEVAAVLARPFTVHTVFADARGDGRHPRIYGFVTTADGEDLAERLVRMGLARAFGVCRTTPSGMSANEYRAYLNDVELQAAARGDGAWKMTDWAKLPAERRAERRENEELELAIRPGKLPEGEKINPNTAARDDLMRLPGVGEMIANRIIESRPFRDTDDLLRVEGIGPKTLDRLKPHLLLP